MTQKQLQRRCRLWQKRLLLSDWAVVVKLEPESEMPDIVGQIPNDPETLTATMRIREDRADDPDTVIVHELIHLRQIPFSDGADDEPNHEAREAAIDLLAVAFVRAFPRRRKPE